MENFNEFSSIEQAAMEQSPAHETDILHSFIEASCFIDCVTDKATATVGLDTATGGHAVVETNATMTGNTGVAQTIEAAAGGVVLDSVFTKQQVQFLNSMNQECSVEELIDLRKSLISANRVQK